MYGNLETLKNTSIAVDHQGLVFDQGSCIERRSHFSEYILFAPPFLRLLIKCTYLYVFKTILLLHFVIHQ